jgi:hypothetical protein
MLFLDKSLVLISRYLRTRFSRIMKPRLDSRFRHSLLLFPVLLCYLPVSLRSHGDEVDLLDATLDSIESRRRQFVSGIARIRGTRTLLDGSERLLDGELNFLVAFEPEDKFRFDRSEPCLSSEMTSGTEEAIQSICVSKYARDDNKSYYLGEGDVAVIIDEHGKAPFFRKHPFDIRAFGLYYWQPFERGFKLSEVVAGFRNSRLVKSEFGDVITLTCQVGDGPGGHFRELRVDTKNGFTPISLKAYKQLPSDTSELAPFLTETVEWQALGDTYVPISFLIRDEFVPQKVRVVQMSLEWSYVNEDVPDDLFSEKTFEGASSKALIDARSGDGILLRALPGSLANEQPFPVGQTRKWSLRSVAVIANLLVAAAICAYFFKSWVKRSKYTSRNKE